MQLLQKALFSNDPAEIPWGIAGAVQSFYNVEQNPLAVVVKIGAEDTQLNLTQPNSPQLNTLGARVTVNGTFPVPVNDIGCMYPFLSVSETEPVESLLEIFYETSTSGNFVDLNDTVLADYGGVTKTSSLRLVVLMKMFLVELMLLLHLISRFSG